MSSPPMSPVKNPPAEPPTTRKRSLSDARVDELQTMRPLKLTAAALIPKSSASASDKSKGIDVSRLLTAATPTSSQDSAKTEPSDLDQLLSAKEYLEKRIDSAAAKREERYEMCSQSPKGSQNSILVAYSQDSQLSGDEPPSLATVIKIIMNNLDEARLHQLFPIDDVNDEDVRVGIAYPFLDTNLDLLHALVSETIKALGTRMV